MSSKTNHSTTGAASQSRSGANSERSQTGQQASLSQSQASRAKSGANGEKRRGSTHKRLGQLVLEDAKIGVLGAGKIADAIVQGMINFAKLKPSSIHVAAPSAKNLENFKNYGCHVTRRNIDIFGRYDCDIIFVCVHGSVVKKCFKMGGTRPSALCTNYIPYMRHPLYILSLVSGITCNQLKQTLINPDHPEKYQLEMHRVMINTAAMCGLAICAVDVEPESRKLSPCIKQLLMSIGKLDHVSADQMDAACAIGGSGLAFSYYFINALADGAVKMGLSRNMALRFAAKTLQCAAQTQLESDKHPFELKDEVCTPSGAAVYGVHVLNRADVASGIAAAVEAAYKRASEMSND